jgi:hypothetical protein
MSDLIEKTARAMCIANGGDADEVMPNDGPRWKYWVPNARAAIAAVAEWLQADGDFYAGIVGIRVERQLAPPTPPEVK